MTEEKNLACTLCISAEVFFKKKWTEYLRKSHKVQKEIFKEIMENQDKFFTAGFTVPEDMTEEDLEKVPLGLSMRLCDRMEIKKIMAKKEMGIMMKDAITAYMELYPAVEEVIEEVK